MASSNMILTTSFDVMLCMTNKFGMLTQQSLHGCCCIAHNLEQLNDQTVSYSGLDVG